MIFEARDTKGNVSRNSQKLKREIPFLEMKRFLPELIISGHIDYQSLSSRVLEGVSLLGTMGTKFSNWILSIM